MEKSAMRLIEDGECPGRVDVERRRSRHAELASLFEAGLGGAISPRRERNPRPRALVAAEHVSA